MIELGLKSTFAYLLGSVLGSLVVGYWRGGVDIRTLGSHNPGGTNALRTQGKVFAAWVMLIDVGKGILAAAVIPDLAIPGVARDPEVTRSLVLHVVAFAVIVGHVFPLWHGFQGGKGGATALGVFAYLAPTLALPVLVLWVAVALVTGFVGLATMTAAVGATAMVALTRLPAEHGLFAFCCSVSLLLIYTHRGNIGRMMSGTEPRVTRPRAGRLGGDP